MLGKVFRAFLMALGMYTALPGFARWEDESRGMLAVMLPIIGAILGLISWRLAVLAQKLLPQMLGAVMIALTMPILTGFLHLDGFMDVSDALLSRRSREEKLRILKDPRAGAFAVIALACLLLLQVGAMEAVLASDKHLITLLALPVVSRSLAALAVMSFKPLLGSLYSRMNYETATNGKRLFCAACCVFAVGAAFPLGWQAGVSCLVAAIMFLLACIRANRSLGGMNGDVAGFAISLSELSGLIVLACL